MFLGVAIAAAFALGVYSLVLASINADKAQPLTLVAYRVDCERVVDLTDPVALYATGITLETLGCPW